jgi:hypothetical protein
MVHMAKEVQPFFVNTQNLCSKAQGRALGHFLVKINVGFYGIEGLTISAVGFVNTNVAK